MLSPTIFPSSIKAVITTKQDDKVLSDILSKEERTSILFHESGFEGYQRAFCQQVHGDTIHIVNTGGMYGNGDALITLQKNIVLQVIVADCVPILITGMTKNDESIIAAIHSGRKGAHFNIVGKCLQKMKDIGMDVTTTRVWMGPSAQQAQYEFGREVFDLFDEGYIVEKGEKFFLDVSGAVYDQIVDAGVNIKNIERNTDCTIAKSDMYYSYRREKQTGRMHAWISL